MRIKGRSDFLAGSAFVLAGLLAAWRSWRYGVLPIEQPGPGFVPLMLGLMLAAMGGLLVFVAMTVEREDGGRLKPLAWRPVLGLVAGLVGFALSMPLGLIFAVPWLVGCVSWAQGPVRWLDTLVLAAVLTPLTAWLLIQVLAWPVRLGLF